MTNEEVGRLARDYLSRLGVAGLEEIIVEGIHNVTNKFSSMADSAECYDAMARIFSREAWLLREKKKADSIFLI